MSQTTEELLKKIQEIDSTFTLEGLYKHLSEEQTELEKLKKSPTWKVYQLLVLMTDCMKGKAPLPAEKIDEIGDFSEEVMEKIQHLQTPIIERIMF